MVILEKVEQEHGVGAEHRRHDDGEPRQVLFHDVSATLGMRREPEPAHPGFATGVHEDERDQKRAQEHLNHSEYLEPRHGAQG